MAKSFQTAITNVSIISLVFLLSGSVHGFRKGNVMLLRHVAAFNRFKKVESVEMSPKLLPSFTCEVMTNEVCHNQLL
jgi:hypothetical protein